jgi:hypothetical protein
MILTTTFHSLCNTNVYGYSPPTPTKCLLSLNPRNKDITQPHANRHNYQAHVQPQQTTSVPRHNTFCCNFTKLIAVISPRSIWLAQHKFTQLSLQSQRSHPSILDDSMIQIEYRAALRCTVYCPLSHLDYWLAAAYSTRQPVLVCPSFRRGESFVRSHDERGGSLFNSPRRGEGIQRTPGLLLHLQPLSLS